ncbi:hypothetical protein AAFF_G00284280 [Aldrovandia affinis]|uniref:Uncharacterized protein n=1 Tax=Aldrovandia affinis TaxID=143900 RepID=A0AAD7TBN7_9TELE|nr:hypothetical protein AAFF_G00284280 [Aldrovandia affinis]
MPTACEAFSRLWRLSLPDSLRFVRREHAAWGKPPALANLVWASVEERPTPRSVASLRSGIWAFVPPGEKRQWEQRGGILSPHLGAAQPLRCQGSARAAGPSRGVVASDWMRLLAAMTLTSCEQVARRLAAAWPQSLAHRGVKGDRASARIAGRPRELRRPRLLNDRPADTAVAPGAFG